MSLKNVRLFIEKKPGFQTEANVLLNQLNENFKLNATSLRILNVYDVFNVKEDVLPNAIQTIFSEPVTDDVVDYPTNEHASIINLETLPGQYDQRADSAMQCMRLIDPSSSCVITCGKTIVIEPKLSEDNYVKVTNYLINPIESRVKDMSVLKVDDNVDVKPLEQFNDFIDLDADGIAQFVASHGLAMSVDDCLSVQAYFKNEEKRNPSETEIKVLDTYWSDHCRHTTFETALDSIEFHTDRFHDEIQQAYELYLRLRKDNKREEKPITLMDMATINSRNLRNKGLNNEVEVSDEINACSVFIDVDHNGQTEKWLLMFKNETHNHPTEIEPFGGASTCIGGAIRDPLSGRSYVYQAMRITGCGNTLAPVEDTLQGKLPQSVISKKAALGNSSYGNQIGLPTTYVEEILHDSYTAKHLEVGAVVGAAPVENVVRKKPSEGDVIILLGGRTGRDGIGGATGSSKQHNMESLSVCASEVQKGNAPEERKIQRLFRNGACTSLIKKCNDFGAGGVCVAIGELADGLRIDLDQVRTKYAGLNATEIAISESQERMAVVVSRDDVDAFINFATQENLEAYPVATVTKEPRLVMSYKGEEVVNISRAFIDTAGVRQHNKATVETLEGKEPFASDYDLSKDGILAMLKDKQVACQKGLKEMFDASIGATTVMMPYGGKTQMTPTQASVQKIPVMDGKTTTCSILSYGFNPKWMEYSPYLGAIHSVVQSMAKTIAVGGDYHQIHFSFQEYFQRLGNNTKAWGKVVEALLGTIAIQDYFGLSAIGGKDSMSGTFNDLDVVPTLISFACSAANTKNIITPELKTAGNWLYLIKNDGSFDAIKRQFDYVSAKIADKSIVSAYVVEEGGALAALFKMSFGNQFGFSIKGCEKCLLGNGQGYFVVEAIKELEGEGVKLLGNVTEGDYVINDVTITSNEALSSWTSLFDNLYPRLSQDSKQEVEACNYSASKVFKAKEVVNEVHVMIPVFPGTNCEYDMRRAFEDEGAIGHIVVFKNETQELFNQSIDEFVEMINKCHILAIPGGFSSGDEPDGSAKFIVNVLQNEKIKSAVHGLLDRDGLILGICNGFQALVKSGLLPYGRIQTVDSSAPTLFRNDISRHISTVVSTRVGSTNSPWLQGFDCGDVHSIAVSHGEGKFVCDATMLQKLKDNGCIAFQYCDLVGNVTSDPSVNINGSVNNIEGIVSFDGHILGKMGHSERYVEDVFKNISGNKKQSIFANGVAYFKGEK